jgi:hypothetical protein
MNAGKLRGFLLQLPRPAFVRVSGDGEPQTLRPGRSFQKLADTIVALAPELVECLDKEHGVLRATRLDGAEARRSDAAEIPDGIKHDPMALMITHFANLLHRAYEHSTEVAFQRLVDVTERMNDRSEAIEQRLERAESQNRRLLQDQVDDAFARAEEQAERAAAEGTEGDLVKNLAGAFLGGMGSRAPSPKTNGATNGKG